MLRVIDEFTAPPGGWNATIPATGASWAGVGSFKAIVEAVRENLEANGLLLGTDPAALVHHQTAKRLIAEGHSSWITRPSQTVRRNWLDLWQGTKVFARMQARKLRDKPVFVPAPVAEDRARICLDCPHNVVPKDDGWVSQWAGGRMRESVENRKTSRDAALGVCDLCKCELRAAVWLRDDVAALAISPQLQSTLPKHCWKKSICLKGCSSKH